MLSAAHTQPGMTCVAPTALPAANARLAGCYAALYYTIVSGLSKRPPARKGSGDAEPTAAGACPALSRAIVPVCPVCGGVRRPGGAGSRPRSRPGFQPRGDRDPLPVLIRLSACTDMRHQVTLAVPRVAHAASPFARPSHAGARAVVRR